MWAGMCRAASVATGIVGRRPGSASAVVSARKVGPFCGRRGFSATGLRLNPGAEWSAHDQRNTDVVGAVSNILYNIPEPEGEIRKHTISVLVENEPGVLSRVSGLLSGRGTNINSLTVCVSEVRGLSRMTLSVIAREEEVRKIIAQLEDVEEALAVIGYNPGHVIEREVILLKLDTTVDMAQGAEAKFEALSLKRDRLMALAKLFEADMVDIGSQTVTIQLTSWPRRIDAFIKFAGPYGIIETARSGVVAMSRTAVGGVEDHELDEDEMMDVTNLPPS